MSKLTSTQLVTLTLTTSGEMASHSEGWVKFCQAHELIEEFKKNLPGTSFQKALNRFLEKKPEPFHIKLQTRGGPWLPCLCTPAYSENEIEIHLAQELPPPGMEPNLAEEKVRVQLLYFEKLLEMTSDIVGIANMQGKTVYLNPAAVEKGWKIGADSYTFFPKSSVDLFIKEIYPRLKTHGTWEGHVMFKGPQGEEFPVFQRSYMIRDGKGRKMAVATVATDLSQQKTLEAEIERQRTQFVNQSKMSALGAMASGIAHEINNPLAILMGKIAVAKMTLKQDKLPLKDLEESMNSMEKTVERIAIIIQGLRNFAREGSHDPVLELDINKLVMETMSFCQSRLTNHEIQIEMDLPAKPVVISGKGVQLSQALLNLLNNAHDAVMDVPADKRLVRVFCKVVGKKVLLGVQDSGKGVRVDLKEHIMEPFFTTKEVGKGTGLGLAITKGIVEAHQGKLYLDETQRLTTFTIELPL